MTVWVLGLRKGVRYHALREDGRFTVCGTAKAKLTEVPLVTAVDQLIATACRTCAGEAERWDPVAIGKGQRVQG